MVRKAFLTEARVLATLNHTAIVPIYDFGRTADEQDSCFLVEKFMSGGTLSDWIDSDQITRPDRVEAIARIADALSHAHENGLVHRDIKPSNLLLDSDFQVYVADFGLAVRDELVDLSVAFAGTPAYMSPEQIRGEGHLIDGRTDIYSLGVVMYELLTGRRPFDGDRLPLLIERIKRRVAKPLRQIDPTISPELQRICLKGDGSPADRSVLNGH